MGRGSFGHGDWEMAEDVGSAGLRPGEAEHLQSSAPLRAEPEVPPPARGTGFCNANAAHLAQGGWS